MSEPAPPPAEKPPSKFVLVIDDDPDAAEILKRGLSKAGYHVVIAKDGKTGLEMAREQKPMAITLDVLMSGMDGWSVLTALKSDPRTATIPVIMVTMLQDRRLGFTLGASEFLTKPVDQERLQHGLHLLRATRLTGSRCRRRCGGQKSPLPDARKEGIRAQEAENGRQAIERVAQAVPDIILLDLMMPVMDGFELIRTLRDDPRSANVPIIVITAKDLTEDDRRRLASSVEEVIAKSALDQDKLLAEVTAILARRTD